VTEASLSGDVPAKRSADPRGSTNLADASGTTGALALLGSGEYLPVMDATDRLLLATVGGTASAQVVLIPAASGLEGEAPKRWNRLGLDHFGQLGAEATALDFTTRADAEDQRILEALFQANVFYFSGGNPLYLIECLEGTPAWQVISQRHAEGAAIAGCSAGAMMLGTYTVGLGGPWAIRTPGWRPALGLAPGLAVIPHFDRFAPRFGEDGLRRLLETAPPGVTVLGIEEDTALVRLPGEATVTWQVSGRQGINVFGPDGRVSAYRAGDTVPL
jgi:cyanophycinase-like exopeptidase